jgi:hypothetical protein
LPSVPEILRPLQKLPRIAVNFSRDFSVIMRKGAKDG